MAQSLEVSLIGNSIAQRHSDTDKGVVGQWEYNPVCAVVSITSGPGDIVGFATRDVVTNQRRHKFKYDDMLRIIIEFEGAGQSKMDFNIQDVTNQAGWTPDPAGLAQALLDINGWVALCAGGGGGVTPLPTGASTEAKQDAIIAEMMKLVDFEISCVVDSVTGVVYLMNVEKDITTGVITVTYIDAQGNVVVPPTPGNLVICDASAAMALQLAELVALNAGGPLLTEATFVAEDFATEVTLASVDTEVKTLTASKTPTKVVSAGITVIPIGATEVSIFNNGAGAATSNGGTIPAGVEETYGFHNPIDTAITVDGLTTEQMIITYMI